MLFNGWVGVLVGVALLLLVWIICWVLTPPHKSFTFDPGHEKKGSFQSVLGPYLDISKFILGLAGGAIVLVIGSSVLGKSGSLPKQFASPLFLLAISIIYGILFVVLLIVGYESFQHHQESYTKFRYVRNQALGFGSLACFCVAYAWLIFAAVGKPHSDMPPPVPPIEVNEVNRQAPQQQGNGATTNTPSYFSRLFSPENLPSLGLFAIGAVGVIVAICTLKAIERQAKANEETLAEIKAAGTKTDAMITNAGMQAKAAVDNIVYTHRPKLRIRGIGLIPQAGTFKEMVDGTVKDQVAWQLTFIIANIGGTDAHVTESNLTLLNINLKDGLFPEFPQYSDRKDSMGEFGVIKPGEHWVQHILLDDMDSMKLAVLRRMVESGALHTAGTLYCLGYIQYRDDTGVSRRTAYMRHYDATSERFLRDKHPETPEGYDYED